MLGEKGLTGSASDSGNALFLILIAVALFAALSYAITQSGRGSGTVNRETSMILAGQVVQYVAGLRTAATRMVITGTPTSGTTGVDLNSTTGQTNQLFDQAGGGATKTPPPPAAVNAGVNWMFIDATDPTNGFYVKDVGTDTSVSGREALALLEGVTLPVCQQILKGLGLAAFTAPATSAVGMWGPTAATYNVAVGNTLSGVGIDGNAFLCFQNGVGLYDYYHVLLEQ